ncbi:Notoamide biosynthesis cluster protein M' [Paramyrothecium foliicola]|nr:Notoamide biosynthesis cluster protein M' [Paramyrothecium foliicola]
MTVKANHDDIRQQVMSLGRSTVPKTVVEAFARFLETQILDFHWCTEGWKNYIDGFESLVRQTHRRATAMPFTSDGEAEDPELLRSLTQKSKPEPSAVAAPAAAAVSNQKAMPHLSFSQRIGSILRSDSKIANKSQDSSGQETEYEMEVLRQTERDNEKRMKQTLDRIKVLNEFPFTGLQKIASTQLKLHEARLVMNLNKGVLQGIRASYHELLQSDNLPSDLKTELSITLLSFHERIEYLERQLGTECTRVETLLQIAGNGSNLYDSIVQFQSAEFSKLFTLDAYGSSKRMENSTERMESMTKSMYEIAKNTERDTSSMHVVTFLTLVFLPGTFLGTFFSTPIFDGQESSAGNARAWAFNHDLFYLFLEICIPLMCVVMGLWGLYMRWTKARRQRRQLAQAVSKC